MTRNQLDYWKNQEQMRANRASEEISAQRAAADVLQAETAAKRQAMEEYWRPYEVDIQDVNSKAKVTESVAKVIGALNPLKLFTSL